MFFIRPGHGRWGRNIPFTAQIRLLYIIYYAFNSVPIYKYDLTGTANIYWRKLKCILFLWASNTFFIVNRDPQMSHSKFRIGLVNFWRRNLERLFLEANLLTYVISIMFPFLQLILVKSLSGWFILMIFNSSIIISLRNFQDKSFPPLVLSRTLKNNKEHQWTPWNS